MAGHNKWANIKRRKESVDAKKAERFSRHIKAIVAAAQTDANPETNLILKAAIGRARTDNLPWLTIERALNKSQASIRREKIPYEAYGPEGTALIITTLTDNSNRTVAELRKILSDHGGKIAEPGSVLWSFQNDTGATNRGWRPKFIQPLSEPGKKNLAALISALEHHTDVQTVISNTAAI